MDGIASLSQASFVSSAMVAAATAFAVLSSVSVQSAENGFLQLEGKIPLGSVHGRIDHMAIDPGRQRLFVAELGNDSVPGGA